MKKDVKYVHKAKIKNIEDKIPEITKLTTNTTLDAKINDVLNKILSIANSATTTALNAKINEVKNKIPTITNLACNIALTAVENKIPDHSKYFTTPEFNKLTVEKFTTRSKQANLVTKGDIAVFVKKR